LDIKWIKTFVTAAEYENFRKTSEILFLAQPTITVHIKNLEEVLGQSLFEKSGRNVILTRAGRRFLPHAKKLLDNYNQGIHDMESWRQGFTNKLVMAVSPLVAASILPSILRRFKEIKKSKLL
jgi:LysR family transcriptional repressor of citA